MYSRRRNFYKCQTQAMVIKFGRNVNDRYGNLIKKTELKSADSEHHLIIPGTFWSRWYIKKMIFLFNFNYNLEIPYFSHEVSYSFK